MDIFFSLRLCVLSPRGLWEGPIANPDESYWMRGCLTERDLEISTMTKPRPTRVVQPWKKRGKIGYNYRRKFGLPSVNRNDICRMLVISPNFWTTFWYQIIDIKKNIKVAVYVACWLKNVSASMTWKTFFSRGRHSCFRTASATVFLCTVQTHIYALPLVPGP